MVRLMMGFVFSTHPTSYQLQSWAFAPVEAGVGWNGKYRPRTKIWGGTREETMRSGLRVWAAAVSVLLAVSVPALGTEMPKRGGTLTYMIPADAPPSFDGHQEG